MAITQNHVINIQPGVSAPLVIHCSQGDTGTQINLTVVNGDEEFDCSSYACSVHGTRSDRANWGPVTCNVSGSTVSFSLTSEMTAVAGSCLAEVSIGTVGTANFALLVENATFENGVTYSNDVSVYQSILTAVQNGLTIEKSERVTAVTNEKNERIAAVNAEATTRQSADNTLQGSINSEASTRAAADAVLQGQIDNFVQLPSGSTAADAELVNIRVKADGTSATTAGNAVREQFTELKDDISDLQSAVIIEKNLVTEFVSGKYVTSSTNKIVFVDDKRYNYAVVNARRITAFSSTRTFSNNFSFFAKKDGASLGKITSDYRIGTKGSVYSVPSGTEVIYICAEGLSSDIVVVSGKTVISANNYSTTDYPYDTVYKTTIPTLWVDSVYYNNIRDSLDTLITGYSRFGAASFSDKDNVFTVTGVNGGFATNRFVSNSNLVRITGNITFTTPNLYWQIAFYNGRWNFLKKTAIESGVDFEVSFDAANLVVYNSAENFYIIFNTTDEEGISDYTGTIIVNELSINSLSSFQQSEYYDEDFEPMMQKVFAKLDEGGDSTQTETTFELTGINGEKYIVGLGANNSIVLIPKIPSKTLFCGNSLLLGMNTSSSNHQYVYGMCATAPENDYCHKVMSAIEAEKAPAAYDRVHGAAFEQLGTSDSFSTLWNTTANVYTGNPLKDSFTADLDLIVLQLGDNVNDEDRRTAFANNIDQFVQNIRTASPNARLLWVYGWFNNSIVQNTIETACKKWGIEKVNIKSLHTTANEGVSGQSYITGTGGTGTVSDKWITHPGDAGMTAIANKIIEVLGI